MTSKRPPKPSKRSQDFRIIGGEWRGRRLNFADIAGLRPTTDRIRETVFNWLQPHIVDSRCLDGFAGAGSLGLEALSRGARKVDFIDANHAVTRQLQTHLQTLQATTRGTVRNARFEAALRAQAANSGENQQREPYDIIFLDPPFNQGLLSATLELLAESNKTATHSWIHADTWLYVECERSINLEHLAQIELHKSKRAGQVKYGLAKLKTS